MQIITIAIQKGGAAKTTTAATLAQAAEANGLSVLAVDMDSQANLSYALAANNDQCNALALLEGAPVRDLIQTTPQHVDVSNMYFKEGGRVYVQMGQQLQLQLVVEPSDYDETLEYSFSKAPGGIDIISVSPELVVTPVSRGESYVLITSSRPHKQVGCFVEVK